MTAAELDAYEAGFNAARNLQPESDNPNTSGDP
jgi:hypothetical protein